MKKFASILLALCILASFTTAFAASSGEKRAVIGADLSEADVLKVYEAFGIKRGDVPEMTITNADEREYLGGYVDESLIGARSISCVYIEVLPQGSGLDVTAKNVTWCAPEMYVNAIATAGITDAKIIVAAPFAVSGTAALTGIYKAYEDITGNKLDESAKLIGTQELTVTASLADQIGAYDSASIVNDLKSILSETVSMTDVELGAAIAEIADKYNVKLTDTQMSQLISLCRSMEKLDSSALLDRVNDVKDTIKKMGDAKVKVEGFFAKVQEVIVSVVDFFKDIISFFTK